jgi:hypothetical protein
LYQSAIEQSGKPETMSAASILTFHDSVELFLELAARRHNLKTDNVKFMQYFEDLKSKAGVELKQREEMRKLNRLS